ncbi:unnamed protein product [Cercopithifilaria johnstoni]|uniref:Uncharacterized protein n=1 Tax=Cercopithifilaria johnstoni TaxID=2874296 RepID=A0A8J2MT08_9BILA|nr:unnamed protein product [Cercopithifilaria johnstoni]
MFSRRITKRLNAESETRKFSKRRRKTPGFTPFKQVEIPESWKFETQKLREAIRTSVAHCHYDDPCKRERLGNAVFEALSGQKTMKAAASAHEVPFTTLQTYFHRSRARMAKIMNDNDDIPPKQIQIPVSLTLSSSDMDNALAEEKVSLTQSKKSKRLHSLLDALVAKTVKSDVVINESLLPSYFTPQKLGSGKRKPKEVHRIVPASATENENLEDCESPDWFSDQSQNGSAESITTKSNEVVTKYSKEEVMAIIISAISDSSLDADTKKSVKEIIGGILDKSLNASDICTFLKLDPAFAEFNVCREQILECPDRMLHENEIDFDSANENKDHALCLSSKLQNYECLDKTEKCVNNVYRFSRYSNLQQEALRKAVAMVIRGECSVIGASSIMELPTSAVHSYVHCARAALVTFLPQQAETLNRTIAADECNVRSNSVSKEVEIVISDLMKISSHDLNEQQKLRAALSEVLTKDVPVTEVSSKYGITVDAFQPYITKARVLLGQSPYPTSSNIRETLTNLDAKLSNANGKYADEEKNLNKMLKNTVPSLGNISTGDTIFTTSGTVHPNITKSFSKHEKQCDVENLLTKAGSSTNDSPQTESSLSGSIVDLSSSGDEFDDDKSFLFLSNCTQPNTAKIRSRREKQVENMNAVSHEEIEESTRNTAVLYAESGSDYSDDEFNGLPRSIRGVAKLLSDTKLDKLSTKEYTGTPENLAIKIDKVLHKYRFRGDRKKMRDGILEVLYKSKTLSEACRGNNLAPTTLSTYVRLVKVLINTKKTGTKGLVRVLSLPNTVKGIKNENDANGRNELRKGGCSAESAEKKKLLMGSSNSAEEIHRELLVQNADVMMLHTQSIINNVESFYKVLINYLIEQQYRRSEEAQQKMCATLECVLLDGLSVTEALEVHKGPAEHVLQVYLSRCREVSKCIKAEFPNFKSSVAQAISKNCTNGKQDVEDCVSIVYNNKSGVTENRSVKRSSKRLQRKEIKESLTTERTVGSLKHLNLIFSEDFRKVLYDYLEKLNGVNFPIKDSLIVGLAKIIIDEFPMNEQIVFADTVWDQWLTKYRKKHPEFDE